jgi:hypothetical protein
MFRYKDSNPDYILCSEASNCGLKWQHSLNTLESKYPCTSNSLSVDTFLEVPNFEEGRMPTHFVSRALSFPTLPRHSFCAAESPINAVTMSVST